MKINQILEIMKVNKILVGLDDYWKDFFSKNKFIQNAKVESIYKNGIGLDISGKKLFVSEKQNFLANEILDFKAILKAKQVELEIIKRNYIENETEILSKHSNKSIEEILDSYFEGKDLENSKLFKLLNSFFPNLEWNEKTKYFDWQFENGNAKAFFGKKKEQNSFYLELNLVKLGNLEVYFFYQKNDLTDLRIHIFTKKNSSYIQLLNELDFLKKSLSEIDLENAKINLYLDDEKKDWTA